MIHRARLHLSGVYRLVTVRV